MQCSMIEFEKLTDLRVSVLCTADSTTLRRFSKLSWIWLISKTICTYILLLFERNELDILDIKTVLITQWKVEDENMRKHFQWKFCLFLASHAFQIKQIEQFTKKSDISDVKLLLFLMFKIYSIQTKLFKLVEEFFFLLEQLNLFLRS